MLRRAVEVLTGDALRHVVDLVAFVDGDEIEVRNADGASRFARKDPGAGATSVEGRDPIANTDPMHLSTLDEECAASPLSNDANAYPWARERLAGLFDDPRAPDISVVHTPAHHWPERGGHHGEHGSLDVLQSRAPLLLAGAGVSARGVLERSVRMVDVAPTLAMLSGVSAYDGTGALLTGQAGAPLSDLVGPGARHVVGLLWDGASCNDLQHLAASGELPAVARLLERGCALRGGAVAEFPSVTVTNHATALTGVGPGIHGIVNNGFYDRATGLRVAANESGTWHHAVDLLRPGVETVFEAVERSRPGAHTACVNEMIDRGAGYSTFVLIRAQDSTHGAKDLGGSLPDPTTDPYATQEWVRADRDYGWSTGVDALGLTQVLQLWQDPRQAPALTWWNSVLTDTGHHGGGPHSAESRASLRDTDRRLGVFLDLVDAHGMADDVTFLLTADHGSEGADPRCRGDWDDALRDAGIEFRDEAYGFVYLGG